MPDKNDVSDSDGRCADLVLLEKQGPVAAGSSLFSLVVGVSVNLYGELIHTCTIHACWCNLFPPFKHEESSASHHSTSERGGTADSFSKQKLDTW